MCLMSRLVGPQESRTMWLIVCAMNDRVGDRQMMYGSNPVHEALLTNTVRRTLTAVSL